MIDNLIPECRICSEFGEITKIENNELWLMDVPDNKWCLEPAHTATICNICAGEFDGDQIEEFNIRQPDELELIEFGK